MALDTLKFVDSIASSPTTRLDLNDGSLWYVREFYAPPPRLRRSLTTNAMTDGAYATSSTYDNRVITVVLDLVSTTEDINATELQKLARELDRSTNFLQYKPDGATSPVFFRTERADFADLVDFNAALAMRRLTIEIVAEPKALGLRETVSVGVVTNDPAAATRGCYFDVSAPKGDVAAEIVMGMLLTGGDWNRLYLAQRTTGTVTDLPAMVQAESMTLSTETTNPGGGPDAAMSGTGTNNYRRTTFAGAVTYDRLSYTPGTTALKNALTGTFRVVACVRRTSATGTIIAWVGSDSVYTDPVTLPATTDRVLVDLGIVTRTRPRTGVINSNAFTFYAQQTAAGSNLDWDYVTFLPADESLLIAERTSGNSVSNWILDGEEDAAYGASAVDVFAGTASADNSTMSTSGGIPYLLPNVTNRFLVTASGNVLGDYGITKTDNATVTLYYHPAYLYVRPATT